MPNQTIVWTVLPNGVSQANADRVLHLSIVVAPRLTAAASEGDQLRLWAIMADWTNHVGNATFKVTFGATTVDAKRVGETLEPELWRALFKPDTFVRPHVLDNYSGRRIISYPARRVYRAVKRLYQEAGTQAPDGIAPAPPLTWEKEYIDLGTGNKPNGAVLGIATSERFIYVTHFAHDLENPADPNPVPGRVVKIDSESRAIVAQLGVGLGPHSLAILPDKNKPGRNKLYFLSRSPESGPGGSNKLSIISEEGNSFGPPLEIEIADSAIRLAVSAARNHVLVVHGFRKLRVLDGDTGEVLSGIDFPVGEQPTDLAVDDDAGAVYLTIAHGPALPTEVIKLVPKDATSYAVEWKTSVTAMISTPPRLALDPERGRVYVTNNPAPEEPGVTILNSANGAVIDIVRSPGGIPRNVAVSPAFRYAYALLHTGFVAIIGPGNRIVDTIPHEVSTPEGEVVVHPDTQQWLVGGKGDGKLLIATPSTTEPPDGLDELFPGWDVPWTPEAEKEARDNLDRTEIEDRDLTARVLLFHRRPLEDEVELPRTPEELRTLLDFHEALSTLGDYPAIMRKLGLVLDLTVPAALVPTGATSVRVTPAIAAAPGVTTENRSVPTACVWDGTRFTARSSSTEIADGLLALDDAHYELVPLDLDGAVLKLVNNAKTIGRVAAGDVHRKAPPALRTGGVALILDGHAEALKQQINRSVSHDNAIAEEGDTTLFAEDLVRGYRVDVWNSQVWRSLCRRRGTYTFGTEGQRIVRTIADEGIVGVGVAEAAAPKPGAPNDLYLHEALFTWNNWSLVAGKPGKSSGEDGTPEEDDNTPVTPFKLQVDFKPTPGSLPKLRFGETYRMRARVVDLAGNSLAPEAAPDTGLPGEPRAYLRFDPVPSPAVVLQTPITEQTTPGEALERLVVRTVNTDPSQDTVPTNATAERHIAAPRASVTLAELHGALDTPAGKLDAGAHAMLSERDAGQFALDPQTQPPQPVEGRPQLELPYLPDPLSRGATLRNLPGTAAGTLGQVNRANVLAYAPLPDTPERLGSVTQIRWVGAWPEQQPFRLVVKDGSGPPAWDPATRVLSVPLPKAEVARVPLGSFMREEDLKLMGVWEWLREYADERVRQIFERVDRRDPADLDRLAQQLAAVVHFAVYGGHAMLTPARELVLVHAVQQPLGRPVWTHLQVSRGVNETQARLGGALQIHGRSTAKVELWARWDEVIDDPKTDGPEVRPGEAVVADIPVPPPGTRPDRGKPFITVKIGGQAIAQYSPATDRLGFVSGAKPQHVFGDTKHRLVRYQAASSSSFREYFAPGAPGGFVRASDEIVVRVPSSAHPAAPRVLYAVPTFGWERRTESNVVTSLRRGHGLRVFLERAWYSSGAGELLGVVIWPVRLTDDERKQLKSFVSQAGADPIVGSSGAVDLTRASFGTEGITWGERLQLPPGLLPGKRVDVAGHEVHYDAERKRWYCDISFDATLARSAEAYGAFVRLALVRFQPQSLSGQELSRPVTTEFMQVSPDRSAVATYDPHDPGVVRLSVAGQTYRATADHLGRTVPDGTFLEVSVEERRPDIAGDLGWRPAPASAATVIADQVRTIDTVLWQGRVKLPRDRTPGRFRLVIKEWESWLDDAAVAGINVPEPQPRARRLVYADIIKL